MATDAVWPAAAILADAWKKSDVVEYFLSEHPANEQANSAITEALKNMQAGTGLLTEAPLATAMWEPLARQLPLVDVTPALLAYLRKVAPLGHGVESTLAWVRSRLPLYPDIPAPQLAPRGYRRSDEYGKRMAWRAQLLAAGLERYATPPGIPQHLHVEAEADEAALALLEAISSSEEWAHYEQLSRALQGDPLTKLEAARRKIDVLLSPQNVDRHEDSRMERRHAFRRDRVREVVEELSGVPREFADAFEAVDDLIDLTIVNVHGQLVVYGQPKTIVPEQVEFEQASVSFDYSGDAPPATGDLVRLADPLVPDVVAIEGQSFQFNQDEGSRMSYTARRLPASGAAFLPRK